jgi:hypothetical protein
VLPNGSYSEAELTRHRAWLAGLPEDQRVHIDFELTSIAGCSGSCFPAVELPAAPRPAATSPGTAFVPRPSTISAAPFAALCGPSPPPEMATFVVKQSCAVGDGKLKVANLRPVNALAVRRCSRRLGHHVVDRQELGQAISDAMTHRQETLPLVSRERDRRFAVTRCWSEGDSNRRSHPTKCLTYRLIEGGPYQSNFVMSLGAADRLAMPAYK